MFKCGHMTVLHENPTECIVMTPLYVPLALSYCCLYEEEQ